MPLPKKARSDRTKASWALWLGVAAGGLALGGVLPLAGIVGALAALTHMSRKW